MATHKKAKDKMRQAGRQSNKQDEKKQTNKRAGRQESLSSRPNAHTWMKNVFISWFQIEFCNCRREHLDVVARLQEDFRFDSNPQRCGAWNNASLRRHPGVSSNSGESSCDTKLKILLENTSDVMVSFKEFVKYLTPAVIKKSPCFYLYNNTYVISNI